MRVTLVTETYFPQVNGVSRTLGQLARVLTEAGDSVQLIHPRYGEPPSGDDYFVRSLTVPFYKELHLPLPPFGGMRRAIERFRPDIIHIATEATLGFDALRFALGRKIPVVSSFHTNFDQYSDHYRIGWARGTIWRYLRWFHNQTLETYVPSRSTISALEARGLERLVLWPRGVDGSLFRPDRPGRQLIRERLGIGPEDVVIGHVSRIAPEKNVEYLARALERVALARPRARMLIVGDGPLREDLEAQLPAANFAGYRTGEDLADHYASADLFAFASRTETFGNVVMEAMASGLPVVVLNAGGPGEFVRPGETGLLIDPDAPPERFAEALVEMLDHTDRRQRMAEAARAYSTSQTWDAIMSDLRGRYLQIIERQALPSVLTA